jgi:outer membrane protein assembly factor BamA
MYAINTSSYNFSYTGQFTDVVRKWDFLLDLDLKAPNYVNNFFGLGNESQYEDDRNIKYYRVRFQQGSLGAFFINKPGKSQTITIGPQVSRIEVERNPDRFINNFEENGLDPGNTFDIKTFAGFKLAYNADSRDNLIIPTNGVRFNVQYDYLKNLEKSSFNMSQLQTSFSFYLGFKLPAKVTLASRVGAGFHFGDFEFYQANYLSGITNLRGFRKTRFAGKSILYNNTELRVRLFSFRSYLFPATVGLLGFNDIGRVWQPGEKSNKWHMGYGGGVWLAPFNQLVVTGTLGFSDEKPLPFIKLGFLF